MMNSNPFKWLQTVAYIMVMHVLPAYGEAVSSNYAAVPPLVSNTASPLVMLALAVDEGLFNQAYSNYTDLNGDGRLDTTYTDEFNYFGYFDSQQCYGYSNNRFIPLATASGENQHFCTTDAAPWSGNFLNWATMTRIDLLRKVLFGGKRWLDSLTETVLERAYLPADAHAFVKVYNANLTGIPLRYLTPYDESSISLCSVSASEYGVPEVRIARSQWPRWASTEVMQCQWNQVNSPSSWDALATHRVYIQSCVDGLDGGSSDSCQRYGNNYKPVGLLQQYGESGELRFGLMSGSYANNISGGVLRKNISKIANNESAAKDEINLNTGQFTDVSGIIDHISRLRLVNYDFARNRYTDCDSYGISVSTFKASRDLSSNRRCSMWGSPQSELYLEALRYFAGLNAPSPQFNTDQDKTFIPQLTQATWQNPMTADDACANCSIIMLSSGANSFDADELSSAADLPNLGGVAGLLSKIDAVGQYEYGGNFAGNYLVGGVGSTRQCSAKYLTGLSQAIGLCPEAPQLEGGYHIAGLAYYGNTMDLRPDLFGTQTVKTYAVELAESMPSFALKAKGKNFIFQPVCQTSSNFGSGSNNFSGSGSDCSLIDVVVESANYNEANDLIEGSLLFTWEDSLWGNDYDYDASSRIKFCVGEQCNVSSDSVLKTDSFAADQVRVAVKVDGVFAGLNMRFSYTVTGSKNKDGLQQNYVYKGSTDYQVTDFQVSNDSAGLLPKPLLLAAKYGGFIDQDGDGGPNFQAPLIGQDSREWDARINATGAIGADGLPDNYFFARDPSQLAYRLRQVFEDISDQVASATNAALFADSATGIGAIYQALFQPSAEINGKTVRWGGLLYAIFIDGQGRLREDSNQNGRLDQSDDIVQLNFDPQRKQTFVQRYELANDGTTLIEKGSPANLSSLATLWDARSELSKLSNVTVQRSYSGLASNGRYMITWLDANNNQIVDRGEQQPFIANTFNNNHAGYLGVAQDQASAVVNYIRGQEQAGMRSRTIDFDSDGVDDVWRLGDIVHSTPLLISNPNAGFDAYFDDTSYRTFQQQYTNRRQVIYVGANDGLLHAFNGGFWQPSSFSYDRSDGEGAVQHKLGAEIWSYAPMNLLPHLRWLTEEDYPHVYYMDAEPQAFDVNIFTADNTHPDGWGTILVAGMRLGGGTIDVTVDNEQRTMRSAIVVIDVTDPEQPPEVLAEITHLELGFTTSKPVLVKHRVPAVNPLGEIDWQQPLRNEWYLVFGSGPAGASSEAVTSALSEGVSDQALRLFIYDLKTKQFVEGFDPLVTNIPQAYAGDLTVVDWNKDYQDDVVYFGAVETKDAPQLSGQLLRLVLANDIASSAVKLLLDSDRPMTTAPLVLQSDDATWVYASSGRLLTSSDNRTAQSQYLYGIKEPLDNNRTPTYDAVNVSVLSEVSDIAVFDNGLVRQQQGDAYEPLELNGNTITAYDGLTTYINNTGGWQRRLSHDGISPAGRTVSEVAHLYDLLVFTEYRLPTDQCDIDGASTLYAVDYRTGTAKPNNTVLGSVTVKLFDDLSTNIHGSEQQKVNDRVEFDAGYASAPVIHFQQNQGSSAIAQSAGGGIISTTLNYQFSYGGRQSWWQFFEIPRTD